MRNLSGVLVSAWVLSVVGGGGVAFSQQTAPATPASAQNKQQLQEVIVTGSRIAQSEAQREQPLSVISTAAIQKTGLADTGTLLQQLTTGGSAPGSAPRISASSTGSRNSAPPWWTPAARRERSS